MAQSGKSDHETKTCGSHGGLEAPPITVSLLGNFHPTPAIEMLTGERGDHGCQAKARLHVATGLPIQPHEQYDSIEGVLECKVKWVTIPAVLYDEIGLRGPLASARAFESFCRNIEEDLEMIL